MTAAVDAGEGALHEGEALVVTGERNLLHGEDLASNMDRLRRLFDLFEQKTSLLHLLDVSQTRAGRADLHRRRVGPRAARRDAASSPRRTRSNGQVIGTLGVIGPTRMAYERVIPIVDVTAKLLSNAMSQQLDRRVSRRRTAIRTPQLIERFYACVRASATRAAMAACYAPDATFTDPVFDVDGRGVGRDVDDAVRARQAICASSARDIAPTTRRARALGARGTRSR